MRGLGADSAEVGCITRDLGALREMFHPLDLDDPAYAPSQMLAFTPLPRSVNIHQAKEVDVRDDSPPGRGAAKFGPDCFWVRWRETR
jgi:hypothetical protein